MLELKESGQYDKEIIQRLYLPNQGISRIMSLEPCVSLVELVLSYNEIGYIAGLDSLVSLKILDLSFNRIRKIENLKRLTVLERLDLRGNSISTLEDVVEVKENSSLTSLSLKGVDGEDANPVCALANYSAFMMSNLPNLLVLDGGHVKVRDAFGSIEDDLEKLRPDPSLCATPPPEPWFGEKDLDVEAPGKRSKALSTLEETENTINTMLGEDCAHLLRKASQALSKAGTKK